MLEELLKFGHCLQIKKKLVNIEERVMQTLSINNVIRSLKIFLFCYAWLWMVVKRTENALWNKSIALAKDDL